MAARGRIRAQPRKSSERIESKSIKLYLSGFRNEGHFCEALAVRIRDDVAERLELPPDKVRVTLRQKARGGVTITATS